MAEEQLTLIDNMSPSLKRIYQEAEKLNKRMLTLKANIKSLEKPTTMSYLRKELKSVENQAKQTQLALRAVKVGEREGILSWNARYGGAQYRNMYGQRQFISDADLVRYGQYVQNAQLRRNRMLYNTGRYVNGLSFEERVARTKGLSPLFSNMGFSLDSLGTKLLAFAGSLMFATSILNSFGNVIKKTIVEPQEDYVSNITRVALTSDRKRTPAQMMNELYDTASRTRAPSDATVALYNRIALSGVRASNERIRRFVETFNKVTAISGTTAQENRAVMLQLAQGIGSNRLGGDEFRSISEQAPLFKYMLAKGMGVNPGDLKEMGAKGQLTAEAILSAMEKVQDQVDLIFKDAPLTIGQSFTILQNKWQKVINTQFTGYIKIRDLVKDITAWMDTPDGQKTIEKLITGVNHLTSTIVDLIRACAPLILWLIDHAKLFTVIITSIGVALANLNLFNWLSTASAGVTSLSGAFGLLSKGVLACVGEIGAMIAIIMLAWQAGEKIADWVAKKRDEHANLDVDKNVVKRHMQLWDEKHLKRPWQRFVDPYMSARAAEEAKITMRLRRANEARFKQLQATRSESKKENLLKQLQAIQGMANSAENIMSAVPTVKKGKAIPTESKKGRLDSVGRIDDDISLNADSIQMMKAIAERQWIVQNEVTVPQKVEMAVDKSTIIDPETIAEALNAGMQLAIASSMRGEAMP